MARSLVEVMGGGIPPRPEEPNLDTEWGALEVPVFLRALYEENRGFSIPPGVEIGSPERLGDLQRALYQAVVDMKAKKAAIEAEEAEAQGRSSLSERLRRKQDMATASAPEAGLPTLDQRIKKLERGYAFFKGALKELPAKSPVRERLYRIGNLLLLLCTTDQEPGNRMGHWMLDYKTRQEQEETEWLKSKHPRTDS